MSTESIAGFGTLRDRCAVVGVGTTPYGSFPELDEYGLGAWAFRNAVEDCGLDKNQIDGLGVCRVPFYGRMGEILGLDPRWTLTLPAHGRMSGVSIVEAVAALNSGLANYVALIYSNIGRSRRVHYGGAEAPNFWNPWGHTSPGGGHALMFQRHSQLYGTSSRDLAEIAVAFRRHACMNPDAVMKQPITVEDHEKSRFIVAPLRLLDYCLINDGAVCLILTTKERARDLKRAPVMISGVGAQDSYTDVSLTNFQHDFWYGALQKVAAESYGMAGIGPSDVKTLMCYDNFSPTVIFSLEGLGFCGQGEGGAFVRDGRLQVGGALPTNTDGGHLSNSYMQGWALNAEAVRQIRGECGDRQVPDCDVAQYVAATPCTRSIIYTAG
ncbi:thiolase family protein [Bordetella petrii]|nr:thiolase family protein [Bordetella petrii]